MMRYYNVPPRAPGMHRRHGVPVGRYPFGQPDLIGTATPQWGNIAEMADCIARGGTWDSRGCTVPLDTPPGTGVPPGPPPGIQVCNPAAPCPSGYTCATAPEPLSWSLPEGMKSICIPAGGTIPGGTTIPGAPPSMPPPTTQGGPPPGLPPETKKASILGLPPVAVYIAGGALGLLLLATLMKKKRS